MDNTRHDEGRIRRGTKGYIEYLGGRVDITVEEIGVSPTDHELWAKCRDGSGDFKWIRLDEITAVE